MSPAPLVLEVAQHLRERALPELGSHAGRAEQGDGAGGDITFAIDALAEEALAEYVAEHAPRVAFYSEDRCLVAAPDATEVLIVDPIDGTRPAMAGLESACVAVAVAPLGVLGAVTVASHRVHATRKTQIVIGTVFLAGLLALVENVNWLSSIWAGLATAAFAIVMTAGD